ncbi:hypothetical protein GQ457_03G043710 [Hibiscus cannabinus]
MFAVSTKLLFSSAQVAHTYIHNSHPSHKTNNALPKASNSILHSFSLLRQKKAMARMKLMGLALALLMMVSCCLAANRKVIKGEYVVKHERTMLDTGGTVKAGYPSSGLENHHFLPRQDFNNYPGGGSGDGSG